MGSLWRVMIQFGNIPWRLNLKSIIKILSCFSYLSWSLLSLLSYIIITSIFSKVFILSGQRFISVSGMIRIIPVITYQLGKLLPVPDCTRLLSTGNDRNYIMVALADWYELPISPQLGKLSGPSITVFCLLVESTSCRRDAELGVQPIWLVLSILSTYLEATWT